MQSTVILVVNQQPFYLHRLFFFIITDVTVLNFALTLEYLEADFYAGALQKFDAKAFADAGFPAWVHGRFVEIGQHESAHVEFLQNALGSKATRKCSYLLYDLSTFWGPRMLNICAYCSPYTDPQSFAALSQVLEGVGMWSFYIPLRRFFIDPSILGVSAYAGAAQYIKAPNYLTAAASILSTEARHASWVAAAVNGFSPWSGPLDVNQAVLVPQQSLN